MKLRRTENGANFIVPIFWATLYMPIHKQGIVGKTTITPIRDA